MSESVGRMWRVVAALSVLVAMVGGARAQSVVVESYTGERSRGSAELLAPLYEELGSRGYLSGDALARRYEARISRPSSTREGLTPDFEDAVERGHKAWIAGRFDDAIRTLRPMIEAARANPVAIAQNQVQLEKLQKGLTALALAHQRKGEIDAAKEVFREILRSFPDAEISRGTYGPEAAKLFSSVRQSAGQAGRGRLVVDVLSDQVVVFINERFAKVGRTSKGDMIPGDYRVYSQLGKITSRVHTVSVRSDAEAALQIDYAYDAAMRTSAGTMGFVFDTAAAREKHEARYAARFAREMGAPTAVVVGVDRVRGRLSLVGALVDPRSAKEIRRASLALEPPPSAAKVQALARFLAGDGAGEELQVQLELDEPQQDTEGVSADDDEPRDPPAGGQRVPSRWKRWAGIAALGVGVLGGGGLAVKFALDARGAGDDLRDACAVSCTSDQVNALQAEQRTGNRRAIIAGAVGGAAVVTGIVLLVLSRGSASSDVDTPALSLSGSATDVQVGYKLSF